MAGEIKPLEIKGQKTNDFSLRLQPLVPPDVDTTWTFPAPETDDLTDLLFEGCSITVSDVGCWHRACTCETRTDRENAPRLCSER